MLGRGYLFLHGICQYGHTSFEPVPELICGRVKVVIVTKYLDKALVEEYSRAGEVYISI